MEAAARRSGDGNCLALNKIACVLFHGTHSLGSRKTSQLLVERPKKDDRSNLFNRNKDTCSNTRGELYSHAALARKSRESSVYMRLPALR
jgi:hypothetical protein